MPRKQSKELVENMLNPLEEEFPSNSMASQVAPIRPEVQGTTDQPKIVRKSIGAHAIRRRKSLTRSIKETFVNEDSKNVGQYIIFEVLIPAAKSMIQEMVTQGIEMFLFGEGGGGRSRSRDRGDKTLVSYSKMYKRDDDRSNRRPSSRRDRFNLSDIYFRKGDEATQVLEDLCDLLEKYDQVTVADYFDAAGVDGATWVHAKWGWDELKRAYCTHTRDGYQIVMPEPIELD